MRKLYLVGLALLTVLGLSMVSAGSASAFTLWDQCTKSAPLLEFKTADCTGTTAPLEWGWEEIKVKAATESLVTTLTLSSNGITIDCEGSVDGTVGPGGEDEVTKILNKAKEEVSSSKPVTCTVLAGICGASATAFPVHLPWKTALVATGDELLGSGAGAPGWSVTCANGLKNECTRATAVLNVQNLEGELEVDETFKPAEEATCSVGTGKVEGTVSIFLMNGNALRAM